MHVGNGQTSTPGEHADLVAWMVRFLKTARARKKTVLLFFTVCSILGVVKYVTSTRLFESHAEVLVLEQGGSVLDKDRGGGRSLTDQMPNFERVFTSDRVLKQTLRELPSEYRSDFLGTSPDRWLDAFRNSVSVSTARRTNLIQVAYRSKDPETAYYVVDALVSASLEFLNSMHSDSALDVLKILRADLNRTEQALQEKQARNTQLTRESQLLFSTDEKVVNVLNEAIIRLNQDLIVAKRETTDARAMKAALETAIKNGDDVQAIAMKLSESLATEFIKAASGLGPSDAQTVARLEQSMVNDQAELQNKLSVLGARHPEVIALDARIRETQRYIVSRKEVIGAVANEQSKTVLAPRLLEIARTRLSLAEANEKELERQFNQLREEALGRNQQVAELQILTAEINQLQSHHTLLMERMRDLDLGKQTGIRAKVITDPRINRTPVSPKLSMIMLLTLVCGLGSGLGAVYIIDLIDDRFRSPDDLRVQIGAPILAMVRKLPPLAPHGLESLYPYARPTSVEAEAFRSLRTAIDFSDNDTKVLTISSTEPGDGKTTVIGSLAVAFAQGGKRILAIDGDMRRPGLTKLFDLGQRAGLSNVLKSDRPIEEAVQPLIYRPGLANLDIIAAGPRPSNPAELLSGDRLPELIAWAQERYDQILIDAPPSLAVSDVQIIGRVVDGALITVRPDRNRRKMVLRAAENLTALGCPLIGIVVNHLNAREGDEYAYGYGYGYVYGEEMHDQPAAEPIRRAA
ncbi:Tyrosine-protein kinase YwqD [Caulifigura coniformis]|uniref:non-specific protein-tyrosine kinase n=1 Tax=Caulifigura coniformis TaxID=2527983 RepID=A0A517SJ39_9PLAN|nr:polysaccharide biosynthesis tyrosine autokinase [Caulifigura coniformis]QDT56144.1 Tyrosine-protein kinase YwqD [Caulifigura coniformis]